MNRVSEQIKWYCGICLATLKILVIKVYHYHTAITKTTLKLPVDTNHYAICIAHYMEIFMLKREGEKCQIHFIKSLIISTGIFKPTSKYFMPGYKTLSKSSTNKTKQLHVLHVTMNFCKAPRAHNTQNNDNGQKLIFPCQIIKYIV